MNFEHFSSGNLVYQGVQFTIFPIFNKRQKEKNIYHTEMNNVKDKFITLFFYSHTYNSNDPRTLYSRSKA